MPVWSSARRPFDVSECVSESAGPGALGSTIGVSPDSIMSVEAGGPADATGYEPIERARKKWARNLLSGRPESASRFGRKGEPFLQRGFYLTQRVNFYFI